MNKRHRIRFRKDVELVIYTPQNRGKATNRTMFVEKGDILHAHIRPYTTDEGVEMCDLFLPDGSEAVGVPFRAFRFV